MPAFIEEEKRLNDIRKALIYLSLWQPLGAVYLAPDNGVVVSTGFDTEPDNSLRETERPEGFPSTNYTKLLEWKPLLGPISCLAIRVVPGNYTLKPTC
jgi:hypothetical protein